MIIAAAVILSNPVGAVLFVIALCVAKAVFNRDDEVARGVDTVGLLPSECLAGENVSGGQINALLGVEDPVGLLISARGCGRERHGVVGLFGSVLQRDIDDDELLELGVRGCIGRRLTGLRLRDGDRDAVVPRERGSEGLGLAVAFVR